MKYGFILLALISAGISSCSFEKRVYQAGFYIHRNTKVVNGTANTNNFSESDVLPLSETIIASIQKVDNSDYSCQPLEKLDTDTIVPVNPAKTEEEYVIPQNNNSEYVSEYNEENHVNYTPEMEQKLNRHIDYLQRIQYYSLYPPAWLIVFLMGIFVYRKAKRMAQLSPNKEKHLKALRKYHRITMIIPIIVGAFFAIFSLWYLVYLVI